VNTTALFIEYELMKRYLPLNNESLTKNTEM